MPHEQLEVFIFDDDKITILEEKSDGSFVSEDGGYVLNSSASSLFNSQTGKPVIGFEIIKETITLSADEEELRDSVSMALSELFVDDLYDSTRDRKIPIDEVREAISEGVIDLDTILSIVAKQLSNN